jgi:hypothetical protein
MQDTDTESMDGDAPEREGLTESVAQTISRVIFDAMHEAYCARDAEEEHFMNEVHALGFQHPKEMFAWCREIHAQMRRWCVDNTGADPAAPMLVQLRRGLYPESPGVCVQCREPAHISMPAPGGMHSVCFDCMRRMGVTQAETVYECFRGVAAPALARMVEPVMWPVVNERTDVEKAPVQKSSLARDESFLTGTSFSGKKKKHGRDKPVQGKPVNKRK